MTEPTVPPQPKRGSVHRKLHPIPLFDTPALLQLLADNSIKHTWAHLLQSTLLHHTPTFTHPPHPITPPPATTLTALLATLPPASHQPPAALAPLLVGGVVALSSAVVRAQTSGDGSTTKLLVRLADGELVESVIMRHRAKQLPYAQLEGASGSEAAEAEAEGEEEAEEQQEEEEKVERPTTTVKRAGRITLCVSSQIGCKQACTFCATGTLGLRGHLMAGEIVEQLVHANRLLAAEATTTTHQHTNVVGGGGGGGKDDAPQPRVTNIVYMGQGEPLDNYAAVLASIESFTSRRLFGLSAARVTVSTVGLAHRIESLAIDAPHVQLALSLHAPTQPLRLALVPTAAAHTLERLLAALHAYIARTNKRVLVEYVLLHNVNDQPQHAVQLVALLRPLRQHVLVNLIPWNPTAAVAGVAGGAGGGYAPPVWGDVEAFQRVVRGGGLWCSVRQEMGRDVDGACGQLALKHGRAVELGAVGGGGSGGGAAVKDIEDVVGGGGGGKEREVKVAKPVRRRKVNNEVDRPISSSSTDESNPVLVGQPAAKSFVVAPLDWRRSFAVFLLPMLIIVAMSFYFR